MSKYTNRKIDECYSCKQIGHWKRECLNKIQGLSIVANMVQIDCGSEANILRASSRNYTYAWIISSGCSYRTTSHQKWFTTFRLGNFGFIYLGHDKACTVIGIGQRKISMDNGGVRILKDVRYYVLYRKMVLLHV